MQFHKRPLRVLSLLVMVAVTSAYGFATGTTSTSAANEAGSAKLLIGKLVTNSNRPITVNGGDAITGTTILSGAKLDTPAVGGAIVELNSLGLVSIAPSSSITVSFDAKSVTVNVASGYASLSTAEGVTGTVNGLPPNATAPVPAVSHPEAWGIAGVAIGSAALIWAIIAHNRANDARDSANAANAAAASLASQLAALRTCLAGQTTSPVKLCTSF